MQFPWLNRRLQQCTVWIAAWTLGDDKIPVLCTGQINGNWHIMQSLISFPLPGYHETWDLLALQSHNSFSSPQKRSFIPRRMLWRTWDAPAPPVILERNLLIMHSNFTLLLRRAHFTCSSVWLFFFSVVPGQDVSLRNLIFFLRGIQFLMLLLVALQHSQSHCSAPGNCKIKKKKENHRQGSRIIISG